MKKVLVPLLALSLGCTSSKEMKLFDSELELEQAIQFFDQGIVNNGEFEGLELKKIPSYSYVDTNCLSVVSLNQAFQKDYVNWDSIPSLHKAQLIYNSLRSNFTYKQNPFNKLCLEDISLIPRKYREKVRKIQKHAWGFQDVAETKRLGMGNCVSLTSLLNSHYRKAGIDSEPIIIEAGNAHAILMINYSQGSIVIDPSHMSKYSFIENMKETKAIFDSEFVVNRYSLGKYEN